MTRRRLALGDVKAAHELVVKKMGKDYLTPDVWYRDDAYLPLCVVGHIFAELNLDLTVIPNELNGQSLSSPYGEMLEVVLEIRTTPMIRTYLIDLQELTDGGWTWGDAYKELNQ